MTRKQKLVARVIVSVRVIMMVVGIAYLSIYFAITKSKENKAKKDAENAANEDGSTGTYQGTNEEDVGEVDEHPEIYY